MIFRKGGVREGRLRCKRNRDPAGGIYTIGWGPKTALISAMSPEYTEEKGEYHSKKDIRECAKESGKYGAEVESGLCFAHRDPTLTFSSSPLPQLTEPRDSHHTTRSVLASANTTWVLPTQNRTPSRCSTTLFLSR